MKFHYDRPCCKGVPFYNMQYWYIFLSHCMRYFIMTDHVIRMFYFTPILIYYHTVWEISLWQTMLQGCSILHQYWNIITLYVIFHYDKPCYKVAPFYTNNDILSHCVWYLIMTDHVMKRFHCTPILIYMATWILLDYLILMQSLCCINSNMYVVN